MNKNNIDVDNKLSELNLLGQKYIHLIKGDRVFNILTETEYEKEDGFYTSKGYNYHTSRTPIFLNNEGLVRIISGFDCSDGYCYFQNPQELIELLDSADRILLEEEIVSG